MPLLPSGAGWDSDYLDSVSRLLKEPGLLLAGKMDQHFTALWDYGHIKFWSVKTLGALLAEAGFRDIRFRRIGRIPPLAKSMIAVATRPGTSGHA